MPLGYLGTALTWLLRSILIDRAEPPWHTIGYVVGILFGMTCW